MATEQSQNAYNANYGRGGTSFWGGGGYSDSKLGTSNRDGQAPGSGGGGASPDFRTNAQIAESGDMRTGFGGTGGNGRVFIICFRGDEPPAQASEGE